MSARGIISAAVLLAAAACAAGAPPAVAVGNFRDGETVRYPVVLLTGTVGDANATEVAVVNESSTGDTRVRKGLARRGAFKALADLAVGANRLTVRCGRGETKLTLRYSPADSEYVIRVFCWTDNTGRAGFPSPDPNGVPDWRGRLSTAMLLAQCFTAERMNDLGLGRRTFNLELDESGRVRVHLLRGSRPVRAYRAMTEKQLFASARSELRAQWPCRTSRELVVGAFTAFDANASRALGHTAMGGGKLALIGGSCVFAWPMSIHEAQAAFMDARVVDPTKFHSDSNGRHIRWACAATTIGAALHELGHALGLPHSTDRFGVMTRGFDHLNRAFTLVEPPSARRAQPHVFDPNEAARWSPISAKALAALRFFEPDKRSWKDNTRPVFRLGGAAGRVHVDTPEGLRFMAVQRRVRGEWQAVHGVDFPAGAVKASVTLEQLARWAPRGAVRLMAIDGQGNIARAGLKDMPGGK